MGNYHCKNCENLVFISDHQYTNRSGYASFRAAQNHAVVLGETNATKRRYDNIIEPRYLNPGLEGVDVHCSKVH